MVVIKLIYGADIRRVVLDGPGSKSCFADLCALIFSRFGLAFPHFTLSYMDDEGDSIAIKSDSDLVEAFKLLKTPQDSIRIMVAKQVANAPASIKPVPPKASTTPATTRALVEQPSSPKRGHPPKGLSWLSQPELCNDIKQLKRQLKQQYRQQRRYVRERLRGLRKWFYGSGEANKTSDRPTAPEAAPAPASNSPPTPAWLQNVSPGKSSASTGVRHAAMCDKCNLAIVGIRYKCGHCADFDLCSDCEASEDHGHPSDHVFLKIRRPLSAPRSGVKHPLLPILYRSEPAPTLLLSSAAPVPPPPASSPVAPSRRSLSDMGVPAVITMPTPPARDHSPECRFVRDVTVEDGVEMPSETKFQKTWRIFNTNSTSLSQGRAHVIFVGGDRLGAESPTRVESIPIDAEGDVTVDMVAPSFPGRYIGHWRLMDMNGRLFGDGIWVDIAVRAPEVAEMVVAAPSPAAVAPAVTDLAEELLEEEAEEQEEEEFVEEEAEEEEETPPSEAIESVEVAASESVEEENKADIVEEVEEFTKQDDFDSLQARYEDVPVTDSWLVVEKPINAADVDNSAASFFDGFDEAKFDLEEQEQEEDEEFEVFEDAVEEEVEEDFEGEEQIEEEEEEAIDLSSLALEENKAPNGRPLSQFELNLKHLEVMGFGDRDKNIELLIKHENDVLAAVRELLEN